MHQVELFIGAVTLLVLIIGPLVLGLTGFFRAHRNSQRPRRSPNW